MSDAPNDHNLPASQAGEAFIEQEGYRIPCSEATYDNEGGLIIPHPVPAHWDPDFEVLNPLPWLWKRARVSVENFTMAHGSLMEMVKDVVLERQPYEQARDWLYHIELLLRRLLLVAAWFHVGAFAPPRRGAQPRINPRRRTTPLGKHLVNACFRVPLFAREPRAPRKLRPLAQKPPAWAQLPSLTPSGAKRPREPRHGWIKLAGRQIRQERRLAALDRPAAQPPRLIFLSLPIAVRWSACLKVIAEPAPYIRRVARRMAHEHYARRRQNNPRRLKLARFDFYDLARRTLGKHSIARAMTVLEAWVAIAIWDFQPS